MSLPVKRSIISLLLWAVAWRDGIVARPCRHLLVVLVLLSTFNLQPSTIFAQGTAFQYQGRLNDGGNPANGNYDLRFAIYDSTNIPGTVIAGPLTNSATAVSNGLFTVNLDFGAGVFAGNALWLDIGVRTNGSIDVFTILSPRQLLTPVPYAIFANTASNLSGTLPAAQLTGTLPASAFAGYTNTVALTNNGNIFSGTFSGNGTNLVNLNASQLTGGTVADARLTTNVALLNGNQTFTGSNIFKGANTLTGTNTFSGVNNFTNLGNSFIGSFFGNGLVGWIVVSGTSTQAMSDAGYLLTSSQLTTVMLPPSPNVEDIVRISGAGAGGWKVAQNAGQAILGNFYGFVTSSWTASGASDAFWYDIASSADGTKMVAVINGGGIDTSTDSGIMWGASGASSRQWRAVASSADGAKLAAAVNNDFIYTSTNAGNTWVQRTAGLSSSVWSSIASSADGAKLVAVANGGGVYTSTDSGSTWVQRTSGLPNSGVAAWSSVASSSNGTNLVAVANGINIYISSNAGGSWASTASGRAWSCVASSADGSKLVAAVNAGGIWTSTNSGSLWTQQTNGLPSNPAWSSVASSADGGKLAATVNGGGIYTSLNWGATWTQQLGAPNASWSGIASSADGSKLAAVVNSSTTGGIYYLQASSQTQTTIGTSGGITGGQGTAVELQYIGNSQFMPVSSAGIIWAF
jgi:photosystem II stability/assembly factor-like uncharacterized protein